MSKSVFISSNHRLSVPIVRIILMVHDGCRQNSFYIIDVFLIKIFSSKVEQQRAVLFSLNAMTSFYVVLRKIILVQYFRTFLCLFF